MSSSSAEPIRTSNRLLAVVDDPAAADDVVARLVTDAGLAPDAVTVLRGDEDAGRLEPRRSAWSRAMRFIAFIAADQAVDLAWYRAALHTGRAVLVLATAGPDERRAAVRVLRATGAHFVNHYGPMATEDVIPWRGDPPPVHWMHHR